jgi:hypothetical protein
LILASGLLALSNSGGVYFTRDVATAVHWATLPRDDKGEGAILVFDRPSLRARYRLERFSYAEGENEFEEVVWGRNEKIARHLVGLTATPAAGLSCEGCPQKGGRSADRTGNRRLRLRLWRTSRDLFRLQG